MNTNEMDVFFLNAFKVFLASTPREETLRVMLVRKQHTQDSEHPIGCDLNHLSLSVAVTTEPTLKCGHGLELIQSLVESQQKRSIMAIRMLRNNVIFADTCIQFSRQVTPSLVKTLCELNSCDHFSQCVIVSSLSSVVTMSSSNSIDTGRINK